MGGVLEAVREVAVVGEDEQALGVGVQPPDVEEPLGSPGDVVADAHPAQLVGHRRDHTGGLVEGEVDARLVEVHPLAVDVDGLPQWVDAHAELTHDLSVDLDAPLADEQLAGAAGADARRGEHLLQAGALGVVDVDRGCLRGLGGQLRLSLPAAAARAAVGLRASAGSRRLLGSLAAGCTLRSSGATVLGRSHGRASFTSSSSTAASGR